MKFIARHAGEEIPVEVERLADGYRVRIGDRWMHVDLVDAGRFLRSVRLEDGTQLALIHHRTGTTHEISLGDTTIHVDIVDPLSIKGRRGTEDMVAVGTLKALMPGRIVRVMATKGESVRKGAGLLVLEAMKMENEIQAPVDGVVDEVFVQAGQTVDNGADLVRIAPST
ncbi:MAG TPA: biotin/lipoyl-containing protein [Thermoanaerobaculia bacterium]|nr:biotin/lipoyl-containing protein [Thermoanaerobaculia bacterium]